ncbi:MAG: MFS transporter [bacterium]|nr:MFS transporter [bacterium]
MGKPKSKDSKRPGLVFLIAILSCAAPIGMDLYLPSVPDMPAYFGTTEAAINLTLVCFFAFMSVGTLIFGPLSDRSGRKPILILTVSINTAAAAIGAIAPNVWILIAARIVQGIGGGGMGAVAMAVVKDTFEGERRAHVLVVMQALTAIAPMVAPVAGSAILMFTNWRGTFVAQALVGAACLIGVLIISESLPKDQRNDIGVFRSIGRLFVVGRNKGFTIPLLIFSVSSFTGMCYIAGVSYVYMDFFGLPKMMYSVLFAITAGASIVGTFLVIPVSKRFTIRQLTVFVFGFCILAGAGLLVFGWTSPFVYFGIMVLYMLINVLIRPITTNLLLDQQDGDTGSASSLMNFTHGIFGSFGMLYDSLPWKTHIISLGTNVGGMSAIALISWFLLMRSKVVIRNLDGPGKDKN